MSKILLFQGIALVKQSSLESWKVITQRCQKEAEAKRDGAINPQNYTFKQF